MELGAKPENSDHLIFICWAVVIISSSRKSKQQISHFTFTQFKIQIQSIWPLLQAVGFNFGKQKFVQKSCQQKYKDVWYSSLIFYCV